MVCMSVVCFGASACAPPLKKEINAKKRDTVEERLVAGQPSLPTYCLQFPHSFGTSGGMTVKMSRIRLFSLFKKKKKNSSLVHIQ